MSHFRTTMTACFIFSDARLISGYKSWQSNPISMKHLITFNLLFSLIYSHCPNPLFISLGVVKKNKKRLPILSMLLHFQLEFFSEGLFSISQRYMIILKYIEYRKDRLMSFFLKGQFSELLPQLFPMIQSVCSNQLYSLSLLFLGLPCDPVVMTLLLQCRGARI